MQEMVDEITMQKLSPDFIAISAGTGCSAGTMIYALRKSGINTEVFSVLKGIFMNVEVENWALDGNQYNVYTDYHQGGYAKVNAHYIDFINEFMAVTGIPVDPIYNGKLIYGLLSRIKDGCYKKGCNILWINTGGMQGVAGFNQRWKGQYRINIPS
jgi:1-aminocyclopropane-1-carboxylate deaminase